MLFYYQSSMFYNHFIVILYHFLVLTYWHSAKCQLLFFPCFLHRRKSISDGVQMQWNFTMIFYGPKGRSWALVAPRGSPEEGTTHQGALGGPGAPWWVVPTSGAPRTASLLYKYPKNPRTLGSQQNIHPAAAESITTRSNLDTISDGVHHLHWCLSDDAWVVLCRPSGP